MRKRVARGRLREARIKCSDCDHRSLIPLSDEIIYRHLSGEHTLGVYPLLIDDTTHFLAVDFDDADWREDITAFAQSCRELGVTMATEISRSGNGAHAWIFFGGRVSSRDARRLGSAVIRYKCDDLKSSPATIQCRMKAIFCFAVFPIEEDGAHASIVVWILRLELFEGVFFGIAQPRTCYHPIRI